jgi:hypothetical protein
MNTTAERSPAAALTIVRIVGITDTRTYEEQGDRWVPIPGSGDIRQCTRCNRDHEVHAEVELADGSSAVVGTGCAARETVHLAAAFRSGEARAKRVRALRAELAKATAVYEAVQAARKVVDAMPVPEVTTDLVPARFHRGMEWRFACGDAARTLGTEWSHSKHAQEREMVVFEWKRKRMAELVTVDGSTAYRDLEDVRARLKKAAG